jgi:hypothetical protein
MVKPSLQEWHSSFSAIRNEEVMLTCLQIGHTCLTHGHLLCSELAPFYINCDVPLPLSHILVDCPCYGEAHCVYHLHGILSDMLGDHHSVSNVLAFFKCSRACHVSLMDMVSCCFRILTFYNFCEVTQTLYWFYSHFLFKNIYTARPFYSLAK